MKYYKNFYELLRVRTTASQEQIKRAYLELIKRYHPDRFLGDKNYAERYTRLLNEAYSVLKDPDRRLNYNLQHNINSNPTKKEIKREDHNIKKQRRAEKRAPKKNVDQEISMVYFKNSSKKRPKKKRTIRKFFTSKFFVCILFMLALEVAIIFLLYPR